MSIITRQERERLVLDLYNQGRTFREIAKEARISFRDIGIILNKVVEEEKTEGSKEKEQREVEHLSLSTQSYKLFSEGKTPLEVSIALSLRESEATEFYKEYWKLKQLYNLNMIYEEIKDDIGYFVKLYKLGNAKGMGVQQVVDALEIADNDLPAIEEQYKRLGNDVSTLQSQKRISERNLYQLKSQIATTSRLLNSFRISSEREKRAIESLYNEKARLESIITEFKSNNEEYLKVKQVAGDKVKSVLTNGKLILQFAAASVIESLRSNPELCNFVLNDISITSNGSSSLLLTARQQQSLTFISDNDIYTALILEEAEKIYNKLTTELTNRFITTTAAADIRVSSLPVTVTNNRQKDTYQIDEPRYNNQS